MVNDWYLAKILANEEVEWCVEGTSMFIECGSCQDAQTPL